MFSKIVIDGYIAAVTTGLGTAEITEEEYNHIIDIIHSKPQDPNGYVYMLKDNTLEWELIEITEGAEE